MFVLVQNTLKINIYAADIDYKYSITKIKNELNH